MSEGASVFTKAIGAIASDLFLVFLILKLTDTVAWSWWWIASPIWIPTGIALVIIAVAFMFEPDAYWPEP